MAYKCRRLAGQRQTNRGGKPPYGNLEDPIVALMKGFDTLKSGQMPNVIEVMSLLSQVSNMWPSNDVCLECRFPYK